MVDIIKQHNRRERLDKILVIKHGRTIKNVKVIIRVAKWLLLFSLVIVALMQ